MNPRISKARAMKPKSTCAVAQNGWSLVFSCLDQRDRNVETKEIYD